MKFGLLISLAVALGLQACRLSGGVDDGRDINNTIDDGRDGDDDGDGPFEFSMVNAVMSAPSELGWDTTRQRIGLLGQTLLAISSRPEDCWPTLGGFGHVSLTNDGVGGAMMSLGTQFTPDTDLLMSRISLGLGKYGNPTGNLVVQIRKVTGGTPGAVLGTTAPVDASTVGSYQSYDFEFALPLSLTAGDTYLLVLKGDSSFVATGAGSDRIKWAFATNIFDACDSWGINQGTSDDVTWGTASTAAYAKYLVASRRTLVSTWNPTATLVGDSGSESNWSLSSFDPGERDEDKGTITYDIGASNSTTPAYDISGLTLDQVKTSTVGITGRYIYLRAHFGSDGTQGASIGNVKIGRTKNLDAIR